MAVACSPIDRSGAPRRRSAHLSAAYDRRHPRSLCRVQRPRTAPRGCTRGADGDVVEWGARSRIRAATPARNRKLAGWFARRARRRARPPGWRAEEPCSPKMPTAPRDAYGARRRSAAPHRRGLLRGWRARWIGVGPVAGRRSRCERRRTGHRAGSIAELAGCATGVFIAIGVTPMDTMRQRILVRRRRPFARRDAHHRAARGRFRHRGHRRWHARALTAVRELRARFGGCCST